MIAIGSRVSWNDNDVLNEGVIIDHYQFKTKTYYNKHKYALLIKCNDGNHILKPVNDLKINPKEFK